MTGGQAPGEYRMNLLVTTLVCRNNGSQGCDVRIGELIRGL